MERFFKPQDKKKFIQWLLQMAIENCWTLVLGYSNDETHNYLKSIAPDIPIPISASRNYASACKRMAIVNPIITDNSIDKIITLTHVLSVHSDKEMLSLIADDFHEDCFSGSSGFANKYSKELHEKKLVGNIA